MGDLKAIGRVGLKALLSSERAATCARIIGLTAANVVAPGAGIASGSAAFVFSEEFRARFCRLVRLGFNGTA